VGFTQAICVCPQDDDGDPERVEVLFLKGWGQIFVLRVNHETY
jgi:hypothetical protein